MRWTARWPSIALLVAAACGTTPEEPDAPDASIDAHPLDAGREAGAEDAPRGADAPIEVGDDDAGSDPTPIVEAIVASTCGARAHAVCSAPWACGCSGVGAAPADVAACERRALDACAAAASRGALAALVRTTGLRIDTALLADCQRTIERAFDLCLPPPRDVFAAYRACAQAIESDVPLDGACPYVGLCAGGEGRCDGSLCRAVPGLDEPCEAACRAPLACVAGRCTTPVEPGSACDDDEDCAAPETCTGGTCALGGAECGASTPCQPVLARRCVPRGRDGEACIGDGGCERGLVCSGTPERPGVCRPPPGPGESCAPGCVDGACFGICGEGAACDRSGPGSGTCIVAPDIGEACDAAWSFTSCGAGRYCRAFEATCAPIPGLGEPCEGLCGAGLTCDLRSFPGVCAPARTEGERCDGSDGGADCAEGLRCDGSVFPPACRRIPGLGEPCGWSGACTAGLDCRRDAAGDAFCAIAEPVGGPCDAACAEGAHCAYDFDSGACVPDACPWLARPPAP